jgi:predicted lipoprotein with Yx(FWY)xxD motif
MRSALKFLLPTLVSSLALSACGSSSYSNSGSSSQATAGATSPATTSGATVSSASNATLGASVLVSAVGMTLYHLSGEQTGKLICTSSACLQVWHPLSAGGGVPSGAVGSLGTVKRTNGTQQVTYRGMPLYTFAADRSAGDAKGQGLKDVGTWSAIPVGSAGAGAAAVTTPNTPTKSGAAPKYGY